MSSLPLVENAGRDRESGRRGGGISGPALPAAPGQRQGRVGRRDPPVGAASPFSRRIRPSWSGARVRSPRWAKPGGGAGRTAMPSTWFAGLLPSWADRAGARAAAVPGRRRRIHRVRLRLGARATSGSALRRSRPPRRRARPLRLGDRLGPPDRHRVADLHGGPGGRRRAGASRGERMALAGERLREPATRGTPGGGTARSKVRPRATQLEVPAASRRPLDGPAAPSYPVPGIDGAETIEPSLHLYAPGHT